jgi:hypothetical protein
MKAQTATSLLVTARELERLTPLAADGEIGSIEGFYFDDSTWTVRYLLANIGGWRQGRRVIISPVAVGEIPEDGNEILIELTRAQIESSPQVAGDRPISRDYEREYYQYYNWPPYWEPSPGCGYPSLRKPVSAAPRMQHGARKGGSCGMRLRSAPEARSCVILARDGELGRAEDFIIDSRYWVIRYLQIDTGDWLPGRRVLLSPEWIEHASWPKGRITIGMDRAAVGSAPVVDAGQRVHRDYETRLFDHYRRPVYWRSG